MPGYLVHVGATVICYHAGSASPVAPSTRVKVSGQPIVTINSSYLIAGCTLPPPPTANGPCVSANFVTSATRVFVDKTPVLLQDSQAVCVPTGTGLTIAATQVRVKGQ